MQGPCKATASRHRRWAHTPTHSGCCNSNESCRVIAASGSTAKSHGYPEGSGLRQTPASVGPRPRQRYPSTHSSEERQRPPSTTLPRKMPSQAAGIGTFVGPTQSHPSCAAFMAAAHASTVEASICTDLSRNAWLSMRTHSFVRVNPGDVEQQSARLFAGTSCSAVQSFSARGSGGPGILG